jgi:hypothetical protein
MPDDSVIGLSAELDLSGWQNSVNKMLGDSDEIDAQLNSIVGALYNVGSAADGLGDIDINVTANTSQALADITALDEKSPIVDVTAQLSDSMVNAELNRLENETVQPDVDPTLSDSDGTVEKVENLDGEEVKPTIAPKEGGEKVGGKTLLQRLDEYNTIGKAIDITVNMVGNIGEMLQKIDGLLIQPMQETERVADAVNSHVGKIIPGLEGMILRVHSLGLGDSKDQVGKVIEAAEQFGVATQNLEATSKGALTAAANTGQDPVKVLQSATALLNGGLVTSYQDAFDIITYGQQQGLSLGGDWLNVLAKQSGALKDLGLDAQGTVNYLKSAQQAGLTDPQQAVDILLEAKKKVNEAIANPTNDTATALKLIGLTPKKGQEVGAAFIDDMIAGLNNYTPKKGGLSKEQLATFLFGEQAGKIGISSILKLDAAADGPLKDLTGTSEKAFSVLTDNLHSQFDILFNNYLPDKFEEFANKHLKGIFDEFEAGIKKTMDALEQGDTLGEALEVGFKIQGVDTFLANFSRIVGELEISFLELVADIQSLPGIGNADAAKATRATIAKQAEGQLAFNLKVANPEEIPGLVQTARDRGVSEADIKKAVGDAVHELLDENKVGKAQAVVGGLNANNATPQFGIQQNLDNTDAGAWARAKIALDDYKSGVITLQQLKDSEAFQKGWIVKTSVEFDQGALGEEVGKAADKTQQDWINAINTRDFKLAAKLAEDMDDPALYASTFQKALEGGDLDVAGVMALKIKDNPEALKQAFEQAYSSGAAGLAGQIANQLGDPALKKKAEDLGASLKTSFDNAKKSGDVQGENLYANLIGDPTLIKQAQDDLAALQTATTQTADTVKQNTDDIKQGIDGADKAVTKAISGNSMVPEINKLGDTTEQVIPGVIGWFDGLVGSLEALGNVDDILVSVTNNLSNLTSAANNAKGSVQSAIDAAGSAGGGTPPEPHALGGIAPAGHLGLFGEQGPELAIPFADTGILTAAQTKSLFSVLDSIANGNFSGPTVNNNPVVHQTFYVQSNAQAVNAAQRSADAVRTGF